MFRGKAGASWEQYGELDAGDRFADATAFVLDDTASAGHVEVAGDFVQPLIDGRLRQRGAFQLLG
ncbi:hypothetical protein BJP07_06550 [Corynebacterium sp. NML130628]|nr:hypothetical protein BJP07_06550 [Corynebacterium sp. NML130628]